MKYIKLFENYRTKEDLKHIKLFESFNVPAHIARTIHLLKNYNVIEEGDYDIHGDEIEIWNIKGKKFDYFLDNQIILTVDTDSSKLVWSVEYIDYGDEDDDERKEVQDYLSKLSDTLVGEDVMIFWEFL
jgi:hypothetical protein